MDKRMFKNFGWPNLSALLLGGAVGAWLALAPEQAGRLLNLVGPFIAAALVLGLFGLLAAGLLLYLISFSRR